MSEFDRMSRYAEQMQKQYPEGTRLLLNSMNDPYAPVPPGTRGTVDFVDDAGQIHMKWDCSRPCRSTCHSPTCCLCCSYWQSRS